VILVYHQRHHIITVRNCRRDALAPAAHHVSSQVNAEDGDSAQGQRNVGNDEEEEGRDLRNVTGQGVGDGLLQVVKDQAT